MNFLARFEAIEKECEQQEQQQQEQQEQQQQSIVHDLGQNDGIDLIDEDSKDSKTESIKNNENNEWIEKKSMKPEDKVKLRTTHVKVVPLSTLVWATLVNIRGGNAYVFSRICNKAEAAHYTFYPEELDEFGLIPDGKVIVEYLSLPDNFPQYAVKDPSTIRAYNEPYRRSLEKSPIDQWHPDNCNNLLKTVLRRKYSSNVAQYIYDQAFGVANAFLRFVHYYSHLIHHQSCNSTGE